MIKFKHVIIVTTFFGNYLIQGVCFSIPSVFYNDWLSAFQEDASRTSLVASLNIGMIGFAGILSSWLTKRYGFRATVLLGTTISTLGLLLTCYANGYVTLLIGYGFTTGIGWGIAYTPVMTAVVYYYKPKYHGILLGVTTAGMGTGLIFTPILLELLAELYGWRGALLLQTGFNIQMYICATVLRPTQTMHSFKHNQSGRLAVIFKDPNFLILCFQQLLYSTGLSVVFVHLAHSVQTILQIEPVQSVQLVSISGFATTVARLFVGPIAKLPCVNCLVQYALQCGFTGIVLVVPFIPSYELMAFITACIGVGYSVYGPVLAVVVGEILGAENLTAGWGNLNFACGIGLSLGAPIAGWLYDYTNNYNNSLYFGGVCMIVSMFMFIPTIFRRRRMLMLNIVQETGPVGQDVNDGREDLMRDPVEIKE